MGGRGGWEVVAIGIVTHQWRCRPVSLGQSCSEREEKKKQREGKQRAQGELGVGVGGAGVKSAACVAHLSCVQPFTAHKDISSPAHVSAR